jgi:alpha-mannosidase
MDWDWNATFEDYYAQSVKSILSNAISLVQEPVHPSGIGYQFNLAEVAWLKRYLLDYPDAASQLVQSQGRFFFLGGGVTSPDNLVCNGEAFIRNYLTGRNYVKSIGLGQLLTDICWIPDDFGQDPELPVVLNAMGMKAVSFFRVPGCSPGPLKPINHKQESIQAELYNDGVCFMWKAADGSSILTQQMCQSDLIQDYPGYGIIWGQSGSNADALDGFVKSKFKPAKSGDLEIYMAPCGGDFSDADDLLVTAVETYNTSKYGRDNNMIYAVMGTFEDFADSILADTRQLRTLSDFDSSFYWTGFFSSRVELKTSQQRTVNQLMATETLITLLRAISHVPLSTLSALTKQVDECWFDVAPSTHHDYITGTSDNSVYQTDQILGSTKALQQSLDLAAEAMTLLGSVIETKPSSQEVAFAVYNPCGFKRQVGSLVTIPKASIGGERAYFYRLPDQASPSPAQLLQSGDVVFPYPDINSMSYGTVYMSGNDGFHLSRPTNSNQPSYTMNNGKVQITVDQSNAWALSSIIDVESNTQVLPDGQLGNQIQLYYERAKDGHSTTKQLGNIYQMGNEIYPTGPPDGFYKDDTGDFTAVMGELVEAGPLLWYFRGTIQNTDNNLTVKVEYMLEYNDPVIRMRVTGAASTLPTSIVTSWGLLTNEQPPVQMDYGTGNHWHTWNPNQFVRYWDGPTFRPTHDYLSLRTVGEKTAIASIYHEGMRSWTLHGTFLRGILFRNSPGDGRGAHGTDTDPHQQNYAFRLPGVGYPTTCEALQESLAIQQPQLITRINPADLQQYANLPDIGIGLASIDEPNAMIRVARLQDTSEDTSTPSPELEETGLLSFVLRLYQPTNITNETFHVRIPFLESKNQSSESVSVTPQVQLVTALEEKIKDKTQPQPSYDSGVISVNQSPTLATVQVQITSSNTTTLDCEKSL